MAQFSSNLYNNAGSQPSGSPQPYGVPPAIADWISSYQPTSQWQNLGEQPGSFGGSSWWDPSSGRTVNQSGTVSTGYYGDKNAIVSYDPGTGQKYINTGLLMDQFGNNGNKGGGYENYQMTDYAGNPVNAPGAYGGGDWSVPDKINVADVIESYRPTMEAEIGAGFAEAGGRLGQSGWAMSTPYAQQLGDVERLARAQMNQRALEYQYQAAEQDAARQMERMMAENQEKFQSWAQSGNWDLQSQLANSSNALQQWMLENNIGSQDIWNQNNWNQNQQSMDANNQQMLLQSILGMI